MNRRRFLQVVLGAAGAALAGCKPMSKTERTYEALVEGIARQDPAKVDPTPRWLEKYSYYLPEEKPPEYQPPARYGRSPLSREPYGTIHVPYYDPLKGGFSSMRFSLEEYELYKLGMERRSALLLDAAGCPPSVIRLVCEPFPRWGQLEESDGQA